MVKWYTAVEVALLCLMQISEGARLNANKVLFGKVVTRLDNTAMKFVNITVRYSRKTVKEMYTNENGNFFCVLPRRIQSASVRVLHALHGETVSLSNQTYVEKVFYISNAAASKYNKPEIKGKSILSQLATLSAVLLSFLLVHFFGFTNRLTRAQPPISKYHCFKITSLETPYRHKANAQVKKPMFSKEYSIKLSTGADPDADGAKRMYYRKASPDNFYSTVRSSEDVMILGVGIVE